MTLDAVVLQERLSEYRGRTVEFAIPGDEDGERLSGALVRMWDDRPGRTLVLMLKGASIYVVNYRTKVTIRP